MSTHLFVYGTLRLGSDHPMARRLVLKARHVGTGWFAGRLYDLGSYPAAVAIANARERVVGDLFEIRNDALFDALDAYEGCAPHQPKPHEYVRIPVEIRTIRGNVTAWTYLFAGDLTGRKAVAGGDYAAFRARKRARNRG